MAEIIANGVRTHIQRLGRGTRTVVCVHGILVDNLSSLYFTLANPIAMQAEVLLYDLRGHGLSERPRTGYRLDDLLQDLEGVLDGAGLARPVTLLGHSYGGLIALSFAARHPDRVEGLVLIDPPLPIDDFGARIASLFAIDSELRERKIRETYEAMHGASRTRKRRRLEEAATALARDTTLIDDLRTSRPLSEAELRAIRCPVLALYGDTSEILTCAAGLQKLVPQTEVQTFPGASHLVLFEATDKLRAAVIGWLEKRSPAGQADAPHARAPGGEARVCAGRQTRKILFVTPPLVGHTNPTIAVAKELSRAGHRVAWLGYPKKTLPLLPAGAEFLPLPDEEWERIEAGFREEALRVRGLESLVLLWEKMLVPLARAMLPGVERACADFVPDLMCVDQAALGGALAARRLGLRWATLSTTVAGAPIRPIESVPAVFEYVREQMELLQREAGLPIVERPDNSPALVILFLSREFVGPEADLLPSHYHFVGPSIAPRPPAPFPFERLRPGPRVLVSLGTVNAERGGKFYATLVEALAGEALQVILSAPPELLPRVPDNFVVQAFVPQLELLPKVDLVVSHAGQNTVSEALAFGKPLVVLPIKDDQPLVAAHVVQAGAGLRLKFGRLRPAELREAVLRVLEEPLFRQKAALLQASFREAGGPARAALLLETLLGKAPGKEVS